MTYLNWGVLDALDGAAFRKAYPYPWVNPTGALTEEGRAALMASMPEMGLFTKMFGVARNYGQEPHDRYELLDRKGLPLSGSWRDFHTELSSPRYRAFIARMFDRKDFVIRFQWQYAVRGCSVSPHCDGLRKIGSQLFYFNDPTDWDAAWGGATLVLDDEGKLDYRSAPDFGAFAGEIPAQSLGNTSFIFARGDHAWHGVRPLASPEGKVRRLFSVVIDRKKPLGERLKEHVLKAFKPARPA